MYHVSEHMALVADESKRLKPLATSTASVIRGLAVNDVQRLVWHKYAFTSSLQNRTYGSSWSCVSSAVIERDERRRDREVA